MFFRVLLSLVIVGLLAGCGEPQEAELFDIPLWADGNSLEVFDTNLGYEIEVESVQIWVQQVEFTIGGESHGDGDDELAWWKNTVDWLLPVAHAHPGHSAGGEVAGEFVGPILLEFQAGNLEEIGVGRFLKGEYLGYNVDFAQVDEEGQEIPGPTIRIRGTASQEAEELEFVAEFTLTQNASVIGGALEGALPGEEATGVALQFFPYDAWSETSIFDDVEFSTVSTDDDGVAQVLPGSMANAEIRSRILAHEFYGGRLIHP